MAEHTTGITVAEARTFTLAAVIGGTGAWNFAFNLGAYNSVAYSNVFIIWSAAIILFCISFFLPHEHSPMTWWGRILLSLPVVWMFMAFINENTEIAILTTVLGFVALSTFVLCLPYSIWLILKINQPEFFELQSRRLLIALGAVMLLVCLYGYGVGRFNFLVLSCDDFTAAGVPAPSNCGTPAFDMDFFDAL